MKFIYLILISFVCLNSNISQPEITEDWFPKIGDTSLTYYSSIRQLEEPKGGIDFIWKIPADKLYGKKNPTFNGEFEKIWVDAKELDFFEEFPDATIGYSRNHERGFFYNYQNGAFREVGSMYAQFGFKRHYLNDTPVEAYDDFSYGETRTTSYLGAKVSLMNLDTFFYEITYELSYEGFGTVITPLDTFENCVMIKSIRTDSTNYTNDRTQYHFYKDSLSNVIAIYTINGKNVSPKRTIKYKINKLSEPIIRPKTMALRISRINKKAISINSPTEFNATVEIFDMSKKLLISQKRILSTGENMIETKKLPKHRKYTRSYSLVITNSDTGAIRKMNFTQ